MAVFGSCLHRIRASKHIIAQGFGFTRDFLKERNNSTYCRLKKTPGGFKEQARDRHPGEKCGLDTAHLCVLRQTLRCCWVSKLKCEIESAFICNRLHGSLPVKVIRGREVY